MNFQSSLYLLLLLLIITITSCKDHNEYRVDNEFSEYLQRFEKEAATRGRTFNLQAEGIIIEFSNLKDNTAGLTHYEDPIRVEIDKDYWTEISTSAGAELMKEDLIFHELGHGLLGRKHLNSTLENGDWKSMMCGGDKVDEREWNINYRGERRAYYLDELFNESTLPTDFASSMLIDIDTTGFKPKFQLTFNSEAKADAGWPIVDVEKYATSISNGRMRFESRSDLIYLITARTSINILYNFAYELTFEYPTSSDQVSQYGVIFGTVADDIAPTAVESVEYFTVSNNQKMYMGNRTWYSFFTELPKPQIISSGKNKLKVFKIGNMLYYFINNVYSYRSEIEATGAGFHFGFMVPARGVVYIDNLFVSTIPNAAASSKTEQIQPVEFNIKETKSLQQNKIPSK